MQTLSEKYNCLQQTLFFFILFYLFIPLLNYTFCSNESFLQWIVIVSYHKIIPKK